MVGDQVRDPVTGQTFEVTWDGARGSASLCGCDAHYTRQQRSATADYTKSAIGAIGIRPSDVKCHVPVDWEW